MHRILLSIALFISAGTAFAQQAQPPQGGNPQPEAKIMHAALVVPTAQAGSMRGPGGQARLDAGQRDASADQDARPGDDERRPATAMLLAAVALMAGIALRRWGTSRQ